VSMYSTDSGGILEGTMKSPLVDPSRLLLLIVPSKITPLDSTTKNNATTVARLF
jgi:hypothetical protein